MPMSERQAEKSTMRWIYAFAYLFFIILTFVPLRTDTPYTNQEIQDVLFSLFQISLNPYRTFAPFFHIFTILLIFGVIRFGSKMGRAIAAYMGIDYIIIALTQTMGTTAKYGFVIHTGSLLMNTILGITWIVVAFRGDLNPAIKKLPLSGYLLFPLAILAFWAPYSAQIKPDFNPLLLLTSPDYGMSFCLTTPIFLYFLILFYPRVNGFAYRITAFNGMLYGLLNIQHFFTPGMAWMGVLHIPLLVISAYALLLPRFSSRQAGLNA
jgi:hypothetical protein